MECHAGLLSDFTSKIIVDFIKIVNLWQIVVIKMCYNWNCVKS